MSPPGRANFLFVHAGAVAWKGRGLILPGESFSGKSTLVRRLVEAGATYYSDDVAVLDAAGRLHPYARTLRFRSPTSTRQRPIPHFELTQRPAPPPPQPVLVAIVVFSAWSEEGEGPPARLAPGSATLDSLRHTLAFHRNPDKALSTWAKLFSSASAFRWQRGEATLAAAKLLDLLEQSHTPQ